MTRERLFSKIHRVTITQADVDYIGSCTIPLQLMEASGLDVGDKIDIVSCTSGERLTTYVIEGPRGSKDISINGAAGIKIKEDEICIIINYASMTDLEFKEYIPKVVHVNAKNEIVTEQEALIGGSYKEKMKDQEPVKNKFIKIFEVLRDFLSLILK